MGQTNYATVKAWRAKNKDKVNAQAKRYRAKHPEVAQKAKAKYRISHLEEIRVKDKLAQRKIRLTPEYKAMANIRTERFRKKKKEEQAKIAGRPCPSACELCAVSNVRIVFDHCHIKGNFRGWICDRCNRVLGSVKDDILLLELMIKYLERNKNEQTNNKTKESDT